MTGTGSSSGACRESAEELALCDSHADFNTSICKQNQHVYTTCKEYKDLEGAAMADRTGAIVHVTFIHGSYPSKVRVHDVNRQLCGLVSDFIGSNSASATPSFLGPHRIHSIQSGPYATNIVTGGREGKK